MAEVPACSSVDAAGEFDEVIAIMRAGVSYANVHTAQFPGGEVRGQIDEGLSDPLRTSRMGPATPVAGLPVPASLIAGGSGPPRPSR